MDIAVFKEAQEAYARGDYRVALVGFTACTSDVAELTSAEVGKFYHLIGNCYIKSGEPAKAADFYSKALKLASPEREAALLVNLGTAYLTSRDYGKALDAFSNALGHAGYATPYKALSGIGAVQLKLGNAQAAGSAYREAALDASNPSPGKALVNLGICFMELDRAADAISTFETALDCGLRPSDASKCHASMGQALLAQGRVGEAVDSFTAATADGYELSAVAAHDMAMATSLLERFGSILGAQTQEPAGQEPMPDQPIDVSAAVCEDTSAALDELLGTDQDATSEASQDDLGSTQLMEPLDADEQTSDAQEDDPFAPSMDDGSQWDPAGMPAGFDQDAAAQEGDAQEKPADDFANAATQVFPVVTAPIPASEQYHSSDDEPVFDSDLPVEAFKAMDADEEALIPSPEDTAFFTIKEEDVERAAKEERRKARKGHTGLKIALAFVIVILALVAAAAAAYVYGYGWPLQEKVAQEFLAAAVADQSTDAYWSPNISQESRDSQMAVLDSVKDYEVIAVERSTSSSIVYVKATLDAGGTSYYELTMGRDLVSWDVEYVELYFPSEQ